MNLFDNETEFEIMMDAKPVRIEIRDMGQDTTYLARFTDQPTFMLTRASDINGARFWTSVPEGKQRLAELIGELIAEHIRNGL